MPNAHSGNTNQTRQQIAAKRFVNAGHSRLGTGDASLPRLGPNQRKELDICAATSLPASRQRNRTGDVVFEEYFKGGDPT